VYTVDGGRAVMMAEILRTDLVQLLLRGLAAKGCKFAGQLGVRPNIGLIEQLVVPRNWRDTHHAHGIGHLRGDIRHLDLLRNGRVHFAAPDFNLLAPDPQNNAQMLWE
jgi:hypothetical protein